ncbi:MAG: hypothetical protein ACFS26_00250 [Candidatus Karelsulcia muelleri]
MDSDQIDKLLKNYNVNEQEKKELKNSLIKHLDTEKFLIKIKDLDQFSLPFMITIPEFIRRMKEISLTGNPMLNLKVILL